LSRTAEVGFNPCIIEKSKRKNRKSTPACQGHCFKKLLLHRKMIGQDHIYRYLQILEVFYHHHYHMEPVTSMSGWFGLLNPTNSSEFSYTRIMPVWFCDVMFMHDVSIRQQVFLGMIWSHTRNLIHGHPTFCRGRTCLVALFSFLPFCFLPTRMQSRSRC